jgi:uncharacterized membrane protein
LDGLELSRSDGADPLGTGPEGRAVEAQEKEVGRPSLATWRRIQLSMAYSHSWFPGPLVVLAAAAYFLLFSYLSIARLNTFNASVFDLGIWNQVFWATLHGGAQAFESTGNLNNSYPLYTPAFLALVPFYAIYPYPGSLLVIQSGCIALASVSLYRLSVRLGITPWPSAAIAIAFLLNFQIESANLNDYHLQSFFPLLFFVAALCFIRRSPVLFTASATLASLVNPLAAVTVGLLILSLTTRHTYGPKTSLVLGARKFLGEPIAFVRRNLLAIGTIAVIAGLVLGFNYEYHTVAIYVKSNGTLGQPGLLLSLEQSLTGKIVFVLISGLAVGFVAFILPDFWILATPALALVFLSTKGAWSVYGNQDSFLFVPLLFIGLLWVLAPRLKKSTASSVTAWNPYTRRSSVRDRLAPGVAVSALVVLLVLGPISPLPYGAQGIKDVNGYIPDILSTTYADTYLDHVISLIPSDATVLTQNNIPQLTGRAGFFLGAEGVAQLDLNNSPTIQYVLADESTGPFGYFWYTRFVPFLTQVVASNDYGVVAWGHGAVLLERGYLGNPLLAPSSITLQPSDLQLMSGATKNGTLVHLPSDGNASYFFAGPYNISLPKGNYSTSYEFMVNSNAPAASRIVYLNIVTGNDTLADEQIYLGSFTRPNVWQNFTLSFEVNRFTGPVQFRASFVTDAATLSLRGVQIVVK